ncbi:hypothetical protein [Leptothermofonsia sp. ETS-13]|uniref:hypothetical protein n=1 Tax=Leptothermofonsia sp. ETS-13 TaxID=3035696 RepID=UPI003BA0464B
MTTAITEDAAKLYQRREALSRIDGVVGPETKRAIENDLSAARPIDGLGVYCRLTRTDADAYEGLELCKLQFVDPNKGVVDFLNVVSGLAGAQRFLSWNHPDSVPGNLAPIPQDRYYIGDIDWAGGKDNYSVSHTKSGIGPVWVPSSNLKIVPVIAAIRVAETLLVSMPTGIGFKANPTQVVKAVFVQQRLMI